jgi:hypothetical protein
MIEATVCSRVAALAAAGVASIDRLRPTAVSSMIGTRMGNTVESFLVRVLGPERRLTASTPMVGCWVGPRYRWICT